MAEVRFSVRQRTVMAALHENGELTPSELGDITGLVHADIIATGLVNRGHLYFRDGRYGIAAEEQQAV